MQRDERPATAAQIEYARDLILKLGYDLDWYDLDKMTRGQSAGRDNGRGQRACFVYNSA